MTILIAPILILLVLIAPGIQLLSLAYKTRRTPEIWAGFYFVGASIGLSMRVLGGSYFLTQPVLGDSINTIGHLAFASGTIAMTIFTLRVFRASSTGARIFAGVTIGLIVATTLHNLIAGYASVENSYSMVATNFMRLVPTSWAFFESWRYWRSMKKREALGLADPIVTNRFLLWSVWTGAVTLLPMVVLGIRLLGVIMLGEEELANGVAAAMLPVILNIIRVLFLMLAPIATVALSLSFFPPAFYRERIQRLAQQRAAIAKA